MGNYNKDRLMYKSSPKMSGLNELKGMFKQVEIVEKKTTYSFGGGNMNANNVWNDYVEHGTWSPYRPRFPSKQESDDYNMIVPTPPRQPVNEQLTDEKKSMRDQNVQY